MNLRNDPHTCCTISAHDCLICAPEKFQVASVGFKPMSSEMLVQCSYQLSFETTQM